MAKSSHVALHRVIDQFLEERSKSTGGYAPVATGDTSALAVILDGLIRLKYEGDSNGDRPIDFKLIDRTKFESHHYMAVPYFHKAKTREEQMEIVDLAIANVRIASDKLTTISKLLGLKRKVR